MSALDALEPIFLRASLAAGKPWPRHPRYRAIARFVAVNGMIEQRRRELNTLEDELSNVLDRVEEARSEVEDWLVVAEELAREVGRTSRDDEESGALAGLEAAE